MRGGKRWVVDVDLDKFFDRVNHDVLMVRVARKVGDKRVLTLIRRYLQSGVMVGGLTEVNRKGTPQGGPLSPLLSNIVLEDLDRELERRGHRFCRYADDCNVYVGSKKAGERVMGSLTRFLEGRLKLRVNQAKSAVARPWERVFLGYSMTFHKESRIKVASQSVKRLKSKVKELIRQGRGRNVSRFIREDLNLLLQGWIQYFRLAEVRGTFEELDGWIRRKLRCIVWRQWKRSGTRYRKLLERNIVEERSRMSAFNSRGAWWNSGASHMNEAFPKKYFDRCGLVCLLDELLRFQSVS
jgi:RNA-directed DNA polymerase